MMRLAPNTPIETDAQGDARGSSPSRSARVNLVARSMLVALLFVLQGWGPAAAQDSWHTGCDNSAFQWHSLDDEALHTIHRQRVIPLPDSSLQMGISLLKTQSVVQLSDSQVKQLLPMRVDIDARLDEAAKEAIQKAEKREAEAAAPFFKDHAEMFRKEAEAARQIAGHAERLHGRVAPYLIRGIVLNEGTGAFSLYLVDGNLCVYHGSLGHESVPMKRRPIVAYLDRRPKQIYVAASMAE